MLETDLYTSFIQGIPSSDQRIVVKSAGMSVANWRKWLGLKSVVIWRS